MPSFDEALPLIRMSAAEPDGSAADGFVGLDPFGAMIAALLSRQVGTAVWRPVIDAMAEQGLLHPSRLDDAGIPEIQDAIGGKVCSLSARTLAPAKQLARWLVENYNGEVGAFADSGRSTDDLREELAGARGVGMVGADAILLAALKRPAYPVDRGTFRVLVRHGWLDATATYDDARVFVVGHAGEDPGVLMDVAGGMESLAARYCRASAPRCDACPLRLVLPEGGPLAVED
jgi:endonuclease-3 related protein